MSPRNPFDSRDDSRSFYRRRLLWYLLFGTASSGIGSLFCIAAFIYHDRRTNESFGWGNWLYYAIFLLGGCAAGMFGGGLAYLVARLKDRKGRVWAGLLAMVIGIAILVPLGFDLLIALIDPMPDSCILGLGKDQLCVALGLVSPYGQFPLAGGFSLVWGFITLCQRKRPMMVG